MRRDGAQLFAIISAFDAAYTAYNGHQAAMERFWTLQWLCQHGATELTASLLHEQAGGAWLVRADELPLVFTVMGAQALTRGARVRVRLGNTDPIALDVHGTVLEVLADTLPVTASDTPDDEDADAGPLAIAVDMNEAEPAGDTPA